MLLILMYHRVGGDTGSGNPVPVLAFHFEYLRRRCDVVLPGERLRPGRLSVCLTFDDAYADFYARAFPLLKKYSLRAVLAVPTAFILPQTNVPLAERLAVKQADAMTGQVFATQAPFCTWAELREMAGSGLVDMASHSHQHLNLAAAGVDVEHEAVHSKAILEQHLQRPVSTFIYPYGSVNARCHDVVRKHYSFIMRVGSGLNWDWHPWRQPLGRVEADNVADIAHLLRWNRLASFGVKWAANGWRAGRGKWQPLRSA